jgi:hypothetical protein
MSEMVDSKRRQEILKKIQKGSASSAGSTGIELLRSVFKDLGWFGLSIGLLLFSIGLSGVINGAWSFIGLILIVGGTICFGIKIVPEPEIWIFLRFGQKRGALEPGLHFTIPIVDTIGTVSAPYERVLPLIHLPGDLLPKFQLHTGVVYLRDYKATLKMSGTFDGIVAAEYETENWKEWFQNRFNSLLARYIQTLSVSDANERGMLGGNLIDRIHEAAEKAGERLVFLKGVVAELKKEMEQHGDKEADLSNPNLERLESEIERVTPLPYLYTQINADLVAFIITDCKDRGIEEVTSVLTGALKLSEEQEAAIEKVRIEKLKAEAAQYEALRESAERIGPVLDMKAKLQAAGMEDEATALQTALAFELLDTVCTHDGAWALPFAATQEGGPAGAIPAVLLRIMSAITGGAPLTAAKAKDEPVEK